MNRDLPLVELGVLLDYRNKAGSYYCKYELLEANILRITHSGVPTIEDIKIVLTAFESQCERMQVEASNPMYILLDATHLTNADFITRKFYSQKVAGYFSKKIIRYASIIAANQVVATISKLAAKKYSSIKLSYHDTYEEAIEKIRQCKALDEGLAEKTDERGHSIYHANWVHREYIYIHHKRVSLVSKPEWNIGREKDPYQLRLYLIGKDLLLVKTVGSPEIEQIEEVVKKLWAVIRYSKQVQLGLIADYSQRGYLKKSALKQASDYDKALRKYWSKIYFILNDTAKIAFKTFDQFKPGFTENIRMASGISDALTKYHTEGKGDSFLHNEAKPEAFVANVNQKGLKNKSKDELIAIIEDLQSLNANQNQLIQARNQELFETIAQISWDNTYNYKELKVPITDPYSDLYIAIQMLQIDVRDMLNDLICMNKKLELKVQERTRDIAYKEANLRAIIDNNDHSIWVCDKELVLVDFNLKFQQAFQQLFGSQIMLGQSLKEAIPDLKVHAIWMHRLTNALSGSQLNYTDHLEGVDGKVYIFQSVLFPLVTEGEVSGISIFSKNITREVHKENLIKKNEQLLRSINQNIQEGIYRRKLEGEVVYVNQAFLDLFSVESIEEFNSHSIEHYYVNPEEKRSLDKEITQKNAYRNREVLYKRKDGSHFWGMTSAILVYDSSGELLIDGVVRNVTVNKKAEEKLTQQNEELKKLNEELDRFVYSASHDLRAPLSSLSGLIDLVGMEDNEENKAEYLSLMVKSVKRLDNFIQDIIHYSRNARLEVEREPIDFEEAIREVFEGLEYLDNAKSVQKEIEIIQDKAFYSDKKRLTIIFNNLLSNALRYTASYRPDACISVKVVVGGDNVNIQIKDNGIGIATKHQDKIFDMFYRATTFKPGSGLGLYIVKEAVEKLRGKVRLESVLNQGSVFYVELPNLNRPAE
ncbi:PAS domain-containing sensor histidine kinase [Rapidithrix thailandica]|uniref:histidine kinase n=1 Tax=Rapidithrix thailandica TaxID=413964 RepID=A0AAW9RUX1_9BACT